MTRVQVIKINETELDTEGSYSVTPPKFKTTNYIGRRHSSTTLVRPAQYDIDVELTPEQLNAIELDMVNASNLMTLDVGELKEAKVTGGPTKIGNKFWLRLSSLSPLNGSPGL